MRLGGGDPVVPPRGIALTVRAYDLLDGQRPARLVPASAATRAIIDRLLAEDEARCADGGR